MGGSNAPMEEDVYIGRNSDEDVLLEIGRGQLWGSNISPKLRVLRGGDESAC